MDRNPIYYPTSEQINEVIRLLGLNPNDISLNYIGPASGSPFQWEPTPSFTIGGMEGISPGILYQYLQNYPPSVVAKFLEDELARAGIQVPMSPSETGIERKPVGSVPKRGAGAGAEWSPPWGVRQPSAEPSLGELLSSFSSSSPGESVPIPVSGLAPTPVAAPVPQIPARGGYQSAFPRILRGYVPSVPAGFRRPQRRF